MNPIRIQVENAKNELKQIIQTVSQTEVEKFQENILFLTKVMIALSTNSQFISIVLEKPEKPGLLRLLIASYVFRILSTGLLLTENCKCLDDFKQISLRFTVQDTITLCISIMIQKFAYLSLFKSEDGLSFSQKNFLQKNENFFMAMILEFIMLFFDRNAAYIAIENDRIKFHTVRSRFLSDGEDNIDVPTESKTLKKIKSYFFSILNISIGVIFISYLTRGSLYCIEHVIMSSILIISKIFSRFCTFKGSKKTPPRKFEIKKFKSYSGTIIHMLFLSVTTLHFFIEKIDGNDFSDFYPDLATLANSCLMEFILILLQPKEMVYTDTKKIITTVLTQWSTKIGKHSV